MGQFGDKTYESDYIEDLIDDYNLQPDFREGEILTSLEVKEVLREEEGDKETFLGIVSFIIDTYENHKILLSPKDLRKALDYAGDLLKDFDYACRWFTNWNDRIDALLEEMENIHNLLDPVVPFDFSKYDKIEQDSILDIKNWERFDENHQFYILEYLSENPEPKAADVLKADIKKFQKKSGDDVPSRLVLAAIALSKIEDRVVIDVISDNISNSFLWVKEAAKDYLTECLKFEENNHIRKKINAVISDL